MEKIHPQRFAQTACRSCARIVAAVAEANLKQFKKKIKKTPVLPISAAFDQGMTEFKQLIREAVEEASE